MKKSRFPAVAVLAVAIVLLVAVGARMMVWSDGDDHSGAAMIGGAFTLTDHDGRVVTDADYRGRFMLVFFGYTFCPDVCPTALGVVAGALDKLPPADAARIVPIFVSVDPERDTPDTMKDYVNAFHPAMVGLTGTPEQLAPVMKAYKVYAAKAAGATPEHYTVDHSSILYLMGPDGRFVAHFTHGATADDLVAGLKKHLD